MRRHVFLRTIGLILVALMVTSALPLSVFAAEIHPHDTDGTLFGVYEDDAEATISAGEIKTFEVGEDGIYIRFIPEISGTYLFTSISDEKTLGAITDENKEALTIDIEYNGEDGNFLITYDLTSGEVYYIFVVFDDWHTGTMDVTVRLDRAFVAEAITVDEIRNVAVEEDEIAYLKFVPEASGTYLFSSMSDEDTYGYLYDANRQELAYNDDGGENNNFLIEYDLTADTVYYFGVRFYNRHAGSIPVSVYLDCTHENKVEFDEVPSTCTEDGHTAGVKCEDCGRWFSGEVLRAPGHTDDDDNGRCDVCGKVLFEVIKVDEVKNIAIVPNERSYVRFIPEVSGLYTFAVSADNYPEGELCDNDGSWVPDYNYSGNIDSFKITCNLTAGEVYYLTIRVGSWEDSGSADVTVRLDCAHENAAETAEVPPTCTENGHSTGIYCADCGTWLSGEWIWSLGHQDEDDNGRCDVCGKVLFEVITVDEIKTVAVEPDERAYVRFVPEVSGLYTFVVSADNYTYGSLLDHNKNYLTDDYNTTNAPGFLITYNLTANEVYYLAINVNDCEVGDSVNVTVHLDDDDNGHCDICDTAIFEIISVDEYKNITVETDEWSCIRFVPEVSGLYTFVVSTDKYAEICLRCQNWSYTSSGGKFSPVQIRNELTAGVTYYLSFRFENSPVGGSANITLQLDCAHENATEVAEVPPTCTKDGHTAGLKCTDCGTWLSGEVLWTPGHTDEDDNGRCDVCGKVLFEVITVDEVKDIAIVPNERSYVRFIPEISGLYTFIVSADESFYGYLCDEYKNGLTDTWSGQKDQDIQITYNLTADEAYYLAVRFDDWDASGSAAVTVRLDCAHGNATEATEVPPTCTENGHTAGLKCTGCGTWLSGEWIQAPGHTDDDDNGRCDVCDKVLFEVITVDEIKTVAVEPAEWAYVRFIPEVSGLYTFAVTANDYNTWGELRDHNDNRLADYYRDGDSNNFKITYNLTAGAAYYLTIRVGNWEDSGSADVTVRLDCAHGNATETAEVPPTCTENGHTAGVYCADCGAWLSGGEVLPARGHSDADNDDFCDVCGKLWCERISIGEIKTVVIAEGILSYIKFIPDVSGSYSFTSISNADTYGYLYDANRHELAYNDDGGENNNFLITYDLTAGSTYYFAVRFYNKQAGSFDVRLTQNGLSHNHNYISEVILAPTCLEGGRTKYTCDCGESFERETPALGHHFGKWSVKTEPTCTNNGTEMRICDSCTETETREIASRGHTVVTDPAVAVTCTVNGLTEGKHCSVCGEVFTAQEVIPMLGHKWVETRKTENDLETVTEFECTDCHATREERLPKVLYGDVNGDGDLNIKDVIYIMRSLVGWEDENVNMDLADFNRDGKVNARDIIMILRKIAAK